MCSTWSIPAPRACTFSSTPISTRRFFLGTLHKLVTDPATSPRKTFGREVIFGAAYGAGIFALVPMLEGLGAPVFYDKLLCVPLLNLTVRALDLRTPALLSAAWFASRQEVMGY